MHCVAYCIMQRALVVMHVKNRTCYAFRHMHVNLHAHMCMFHAEMQCLKNLHDYNTMWNIADSWSTKIILTMTAHDKAMTMLSMKSHACEHTNSCCNTIAWQIQVLLSSCMRKITFLLHVSFFIFLQKKEWNVIQNFIALT